MYFQGTIEVIVFVDWEQVEGIKKKKNAPGNFPATAHVIFTSGKISSSYNVLFILCLVPEALA